MPRLSIRSRNVELAADVPEPLARRLRQVKRRVNDRGGRSKGPLVIERDLPRLHIQRRDPSEAVAYFRGIAGGSGPQLAAGRPDALDLADEVTEHFWYHTIELPGGVVTPGVYDHRPLVPHYGLPASLDGMRALDVATFDGFWAFEFERRGARVVATDVGRFSDSDFPPAVREALVAEGLDRETGAAFRLAHQALHSSVERIERSVYELDPQTIGTFDVVNVGDLLLHLENPLGALRSIRSVTSGYALIADCFDPNVASGLTRYLGGWAGVPMWLPSLDALGQMVVDAGFVGVELRDVYRLAPRGEGWGGHWRALLVATP